jgi:hypothetical protein
MLANYRLETFFAGLAAGKGGYRLVVQFWSNGDCGSIILWIIPEGTITGRSKNGRLRAHNRFMDPELVSHTHNFQVAILLGAHELG